MGEKLEREKKIKEGRRAELENKMREGRDILLEGVKNVEQTTREEFKKFGVGLLAMHNKLVLLFVLFPFLFVFTFLPIIR